MTHKERETIRQTHKVVNSMASTNTVGPLLSYVEAGQIAGLDARIISRGVKAGQIPSLKIASRIWIPREAFGKFLAGELAGG